MTPPSDFVIDAIVISINFLIEPNKGGVGLSGQKMGSKTPQIAP